jgi:transcriptional regulator with XRE-family HTH domain
MAGKNIVGWRIRQLRIEKGMTVAQLSSALPTPSFLSSEELIQVELGNRKVYDHELWAISRALGVSVADLYHASPGKRPTKQEPK